MREGGKRLIVAPPGPLQKQGTKSLLWVVGLSEAIEDAGLGAQHLHCQFFLMQLKAFSSVFVWCGAASLLHVEYKTPRIASMAQ